MGVTISGMDDIEKYLRKKIDTYLLQVITTLQSVGEEAVNKARQTVSYKDQTGNLRSSIGYIIIQDGKIVTRSSFDAVPGSDGKKGESGKKAGIDYADSFALKFPEGITLVVVAGMPYAYYVQYKYGRDVIASAENFLRSNIHEKLQKIPV